MRNTFDRFNGRHQDYQAARPSYAQEFLDWLGELYAPPERYTAADIGSGTGKLSAQLLAAGFRVCGVEPNPDMRGAAEALEHTVRTLESERYASGGFSRIIIADCGMDEDAQRVAQLLCRESFDVTVCPQGDLARQFD